MGTNVLPVLLSQKLWQGISIATGKTLPLAPNQGQLPPPEGKNVTLVAVSATVTGVAAILGRAAWDWAVSFSLLFGVLLRLPSFHCHPQKATRFDHADLVHVGDQPLWVIWR